MTIFCWFRVTLIGEYAGARHNRKSNPHNPVCTLFLVTLTKIMCSFSFSFLATSQIYHYTYVYSPVCGCSQANDKFSSCSPHVFPFEYKRKCCYVFMRRLLPLLLLLFQCLSVYSASKWILRCWFCRVRERVVYEFLPAYAVCLAPFSSSLACGLSCQHFLPLPFLLHISCEKGNFKALLSETGSKSSLSR